MYCVAGGESPALTTNRRDIMARFIATQHEAYNSDVVTFSIESDDGLLAVQVSGPHMTADGFRRWLCAEARKLNNGRPGVLRIAMRAP